MSKGAEASRVLFSIPARKVPPHARAMPTHKAECPKIPEACSKGVSLLRHSERLVAGAVDSNDSDVVTYLQDHTGTEELCRGGFWLLPASNACCQQSGSLEVINVDQLLMDFP